MRIALVPLALMAMSPPQQGATPRPSSEPALPPAILDYYRKHNFVTAFSTQKERQVLAQDPGSNPDPRLKRVARMMRQLQWYVEPMDPGMTLWRGSSSAVIDRSDLLRIRSFRVNEDRARVVLERKSIGPAHVQFYIARFGELPGGDQMPDVDELGAPAGAAAVVWTELHDWRAADGQWQRMGPIWHFVNR